MGHRRQAPSWALPCCLATLLLAGLVQGESEGDDKLAVDEATLDVVPDLPKCVPQGMLTLDEPYPAPSIQADLPFCKQWDGCTCCNATHARNIQGLLLMVAKDTSFSRACLNVLRTLHCRVCDPMVGTGYVQSLCPQLCIQWHHACQNDYFVFATSNETWLKFMPCPKQLVRSHDGCKLLKEQVAGPHDLCVRTGHSVTRGKERCYSGRHGHAHVCTHGKHVLEQTWWEWGGYALMVILAPVVFALGSLAVLKVVELLWKSKPLTPVRTALRRKRD